MKTKLIIDYLAEELILKRSEQLHDVGQSVTRLGE
jgi:xanthine dehydrogenase molybdopterin-binding subunit B